jgi:hypothetical protein
MTVSGPPGAVDFAALAAKLDPAELAALVEVIGTAPGEYERWRRQTQAAVRSAARAAQVQGRAEGAVRAIEQLKRAQHDIVNDLALYRRRYHLACPSCRRDANSPDFKVRMSACPTDPHGVCVCPGCENRTQATFSQPMPGEYAGGPADPW